MPFGLGKKKGAPIGNKNAAGRHNQKAIDTYNKSFMKAYGDVKAGKTRGIYATNMAMGGVLGAGGGALAAKSAEGAVFGALGGAAVWGLSTYEGVRGIRKGTITPKKNSQGVYEYVRVKK